ncbi:MAG: hypothetical protein OIF54_18905, partial [Cohaesibacter sp.]|nr:hypothetical protein [Cohaesibacter sp.]
QDFVKSPLSITPSNKPCGNFFAKDHIHPNNEARAGCQRRQRTRQPCVPQWNDQPPRNKNAPQPFGKVFEEDPAAHALYKMQNGMD